ncbi:hypothetical protein DCAR_0207057 [Daucus carota subsp. sativus]|uniref:Uncharacterized protein n=1 Tax=Daucus carota subsp. sativus TaxID=79200 RepID=A0AAF1APQ2_DAUCS|nr:PREDICTED: uncharacterized protein LOC108205613 [Daucus carota subsp. sativus]WOG87825.1 hypothetical protein DCAR_0207057 [Daucus carota subsp. sativus]
MWACRGSFQPWPLDSTTPTQPSNRRIFFVSAKFQPRRSRRQNTNFNYNLHDDDDENDDVQVPTPEPEDTVIFQSGDSGVQVPSGSDILRALQRATVRKHNTKKKKLLRPAPDSKAKTDMNSTSSGVETPPVKPLRIRSDWSSRLDELERRLQDLLQ